MMITGYQVVVDSAAQVNWRATGRMKRLERAIVTLTTDFGLRDGYVAAMKGVIWRIAPQVSVVDVTHQVERHQVLPAAFVLRQTVAWFPANTVHVAVVDPGVGTERRIIAARFADQFIVAPDNGLVSLVHRDFPVEEVHVVENTGLFMPSVSSTFHGRDIIAPVAAHLANGAGLGDVGRATDHMEVLPTPRPRRLAYNSYAGQILYADAFGNLITNIMADDLVAMRRLRPDVEVTVNGQSLGSIRNTYADVPSGHALALVGSSGMLEIAVNAASAAERFAPASDAVVVVR
jgi:S-adenosylmethionine hydrolase